MTRSLYPREKVPGTHWLGGWVVDDVEKRKFLALPGLELRPLGCPNRSQSLYQLRYPGSSAATDTHAKIQKLLKVVFYAVRAEAI
jgi:hypothetical protein